MANRTKGCRISDIFAKDAFCIDKIVQERNSPQIEFLVRVNNYEYLMSYKELERLCNTYGVNLNLEIAESHYPRMSYDNRPLWKKDMDFRMGKTVDFTNNSLHTSNISADRVLSLVGNRAAVFAEEIEEPELD